MSLNLPEKIKTLTIFVRVTLPGRAGGGDLVLNDEVLRQRLLVLGVRQRDPHATPPGGVQAAVVKRSGKKFAGISNVLFVLVTD